MIIAYVMNRTDDYNFRRATLDDHALLHYWQSKPHVREWWEADEMDLLNTRVVRWIVSYFDRPFAFI